jgi:hypothetical protein
MTSAGADSDDAYFAPVQFSIASSSAIASA